MAAWAAWRSVAEALGDVLELPTLILLRVGARLVAAPYARGLSKPAQIALAAVRDELRYRHVRLPDLGLRGSHDRAGARRALTFTVT